MNRLAFYVALISCFALADSSANAQYCPQFLEGSMGGVNYYYCQYCNQGCTAWTVVATNDPYTPGGNCSNCGSSCTDQIGMGVGPLAAKPAGGDVKKTGDKPGILAATQPMHDIKLGVNKDGRPVVSSGVTAVDTVTGGATPAKISTKYLYTLVAGDSGGAPHYFACFEVTDTINPDVTAVWRIAHEWRNAPQSGTTTIKVGNRQPGGHNYHRITPTDMNDHRTFDGFSMTDLDP